MCKERHLERRSQFLNLWTMQLLTHIAFTFSLQYPLLIHKFWNDLTSSFQKAFFTHVLIICQHVHSFQHVEAMDSDIWINVSLMMLDADSHCPILAYRLMLQNVITFHATGILLESWVVYTGRCGHVTYVTDLWWLCLMLSVYCWAFTWTQLVLPTAAFFSLPMIQRILPFLRVWNLVTTPLDLHADCLIPDPYLCSHYFIKSLFRSCPWRFILLTVHTLSSNMLSYSPLQNSSASLQELMHMLHMSTNIYKKHHQRINAD